MKARSWLGWGKRSARSEGQRETAVPAVVAEQALRQHISTNENLEALKSENGLDDWKDMEGVGERRVENDDLNVKLIEW